MEETNKQTKPTNQNNQNENVDPAQQLYKTKNKDLDLKREVDPFAMWSFAICWGFLFFLGPLLPFVGWLISIVSIILAIVGLSRISKNKNLKGKGFAITALIISSLILIGSMFFLAVFLLSIFA